MVRRTGMLWAIIALVAATAQADMALEFGRGAQKLTAIDFSGDVSKRHQVVIDFFEDDPRDLGAFVCYEAPLRDLESRARRGVGIDCLRINPVISDPLVGDDFEPEHVTPVVGDALSPQIDAVTFFFLRHGHIVADGLTTVRPIFDGVGDGIDSDGDAGPFGAITHITGSIPGRDSNIVHASGKYSHLKRRGRVRLSGAVNTDSFFLEEGNPMAFSCYFTIMKRRGHSHGHH